MDITIDDDQTMLRETALAFAQEALTPAAIRALEATEHGFDAKVWRQMAEMGWAGAGFPEEYGGSGTGLLELALIIEALGQRSCRARSSRRWSRQACSCSMPARRPSARAICLASR